MISARRNGCVLEAVGIVGVPARRDADIGQPEQAFDRRPFADIVTLGKVADPLQQIAENDCADAPIPIPEEEHDNAADGERYADQVDIEVERQLMAQSPALQTAAKEAQNGPAG